MVSKRDSDGKITSTLGAILHMFLVAFPKDLWRWMTLRRKCVKDQVVVITGGASGLGQRMAEMFAWDLGAKVAILDVDEARAESVAQNIQSKGGTAKSWKCDVADAKSMEHCAAQVREVFGSVDIVICNAAILYFGHALQLTTAELQRALNVNVMGTVNTIRAFLDEMEKNNRGQIVAISSIAGWFGETYGMAYCPTKFAVRGIMECLRMELHDRRLDGIVCSTLCPYFVRTPMILSKGMRPTSRWISFMSIERCARQAVDAILKEKVLAFVPSWIFVMPIIKILLSLNMQRTARDYLNCRYEPAEHTNVRPSQNSHSNGVTANGLAKCTDHIQKNGTTPCMANGDAIDVRADKSCSVTEERHSGIASPSQPLLEPLPINAMPNYFRMANLLWYAVIPAGLLLTFVVWHRPEAFKAEWLGYFGALLYRIGNDYSVVMLLINIGAWTAHFAEGVYTLYVSDELNFSHACALKWFLQTTLLGYPSLSSLLRYRKKRLANKN
ncbi:short chain dehydrogenase domain-containing protein [Ditylenchus destructor]|nr:short chain dehydrogenase domain-containing protein [Ditylenchus destructor]